MTGTLATACALAMLLAPTLVAQEAVTAQNAVAETPAGPDAEAAIAQGISARRVFAVSAVGIAIIMLVRLNKRNIVIDPLFRTGMLGGRFYEAESDAVVSYGVRFSRPVVHHPTMMADRPRQPRRPSTTRCRGRRLFHRCHRLRHGCGRGTRAL